MADTRAGTAGATTEIRRRGLRPVGNDRRGHEDAAKRVLARLNDLDVWSMPFCLAPPGSVLTSKPR